MGGGGGDMIKNKIPKCCHDAHRIEYYEVNFLYIDSLPNKNNNSIANTVTKK